MQLLHGADGARPRRHAVPRVRAPAAPRARPAGTRGPASPASRPSGTSSRRPRRCSRSGRGTPTCCSRSRRTPTASRSRAALVDQDARGQRLRQGALRAHPDVLRRALLHAAPGRARRHHRHDARAPGEVRRASATSRTRHFFASFGHLEGYGSGYYTYMWSLVIAKDLFSAFDRDDLFATDVAHRYRDRVLAAGRQPRTPPTWSRTSSAGPTASRRSRPGWTGSDAPGGCARVGDGRAAGLPRRVARSGRQRAGSRGPPAAAGHPTTAAEWHRVHPAHCHTVGDREPLP